MPLFTVKLIRDQIIREMVVVQAREAALHGCYLQGIPYLPKDADLRDLLPARYRKAFDRASKWWVQHSDVVKCDLHDTKGKPMGTLFAQARW